MQIILAAGLVVLLAVSIYAVRALFRREIEKLESLTAKTSTVRESGGSAAIGR